MQIIDRKGTVTIRLTQAEGRRLRDAAYIATRAALNLSDTEKSKALNEAAALMLKCANEYTPESSQEKLNREDAEDRRHAAGL